MSPHLLQRNKRYHINKSTKSFNINLKGLAVIEICPTEMCTRKCGFCPRSDEKVYKNQRLHISEETTTNLALKCKEEEYSGDFHISGFGEPLLHPAIENIIKILKNYLPNRVVLTTNGDPLYPSVIQNLYKNGLDHLIISCYDGPDKKIKFLQMLDFVGIPNSQYEIRDLWLGDTESITEFATRNNFNNRSGAATGVKLQPIPGQCYLPFYKLVFDWNGDALLCCNDWQRKACGFGNINKYSLSEIWYGEPFTKVREELYEGRRINEACENCSINGTLIGKESVDLLIKK
jgi:radical SAM protein with 4Fe4S-binding SPASM domain